MRLMIINGSVRVGRRADQVQAWIVDVLRADAELELDVVDLQKVDLPFYNEPVVPSMPNVQYKNPKGAAWAKRVAEADAFIMITPEYNYGTSAVLKNAIDWVYAGWNDKPVSFISYGALVGGSRAVQQLRQNIVNIKLYSTPSAIHIPFVSEAFDTNGKPVHASLNDSLKSLVNELKDLQRRLAS